MRLPGFVRSFTTLALTIPFSYTAVAAIEGNPFQTHRDIGKVSHPGSFLYDAAAKTFVLEGSGSNVWGTNDAFFFSWAPVSGDVALSGAVTWLTKGQNPHRKAMLMIRETLDADSAYVDVALHGDGLSSLQFRDAKGGPTREVQFGTNQPALAGIRRQGDVFYAVTGTSGADLQPVGAFIRVKMPDTVYVGLGVCSHEDAVVERARFSQTSLRQENSTSTNRTLYSSLESVNIGSRDRRLIYSKAGHFEAPNWAPDGSFLLFNSKGSIYRISPRGGEPALLDTGFANRCNNDHGISADGKWLAISDGSKNGKSMIYTVPITGGTPKLITENAPSYWHGWSPDGKTLAYCAEREGEFDVYTIPAAGGQETRLTTAKGLDDGPEYSPDGKYIYFNSDRTGKMQIWRMQTDGSSQEQVTNDEFNNWFAHPSPDGKWLVFLSYEPEVKGHPADKPVTLRLMPVGGGPIQVLASLFGGQGTINVPSWSPDSKNVAFVSYEYLR